MKKNKQTITFKEIREHMGKKKHETIVETMKRVKKEKIKKNISQKRPPT